MLREFFLSPGKLLAASNEQTDCSEDLSLNPKEPFENSEMEGESPKGRNFPNPVAKRYRHAGDDTEAPAQLMDRSGIVRSSFVRRPTDRGKMPTEIVGHVYGKKLKNFLQKTASTGLLWCERPIMWPEEQIAKQRRAHQAIIEFQATPEELARIEYYITQDIHAEDVEQLPEYLWEQVMRKTNPKYIADKRLFSLLRWLRQRAEQDWDRGSREALLREVLLDPWQQQRLKVRALPSAFPRFVVTEPVPWSSGDYRTWKRQGPAAREFCAKSLFAASSVVLTMHLIWEKALGDTLEILPTEEIASICPFYLNDLEEKVTIYLTTARHRILHYLFLCAEHMWEHQRQWESLVSRQEGVSEDLVRLMNCLSSLACRRLREKTLDAKDAWQKLILRTKETDVEYPHKPLVKFRLDESTQIVRANRERCKKFVSSTFENIFRVTRELPSVATLMFNPDHKFRNAVAH